MRYFKKEGKFKLRLAEGSEAKDLLEDGWQECTKRGLPLTEEKKKTKKKSK